MRRCSIREEKKSKIMSLAIRPSTFEAITKLAIVDQSSTNDFINTVLETCIANRQHDIKRYDDFYGNKE